MNRHRRAPMAATAAIAVLLVLTGTGCSTGNSSGATDHITIGLITDLTGPVKSFGTDIRTATKLAVDQINRAGGIDGAMVRLVVKDTQGQPDKAVLAVRQLADHDKALALLGPLSSSEAEVGFAQAARLQLPILTGTANKEHITDIGKGWAFRDQATNTDLYSAAMPLYKGRFNVTRVALVFDQKAQVAAAAAMFAMPAEAKQLGIQVVEQIPFESGQTDFTSVVQRIKGLDIDGLFVASLAVEGGLIARELARQGVDLPVLGHPAQNSNAFMQAAGGSVHDWVVPSIFYTQALGPKAQAFTEAMKGLDTSPPTVPDAGNYYDIVNMIRQVALAAKITPSTALEQARKELRDGLASLSGFQGVVGTTTFLPNGDATKQVFTLLLNGDTTEQLG